MFIEPLIVNNTGMKHLQDIIFQNINQGELLKTKDNKMSSLQLQMCHCGTGYFLTFKRIILSSYQGSSLSSLAA
jgi:hypothetical protein